MADELDLKLDANSARFVAGVETAIKALERLRSQVAITKRQIRTTFTGLGKLGVPAAKAFDTVGQSAAKASGRVTKSTTTIRTDLKSTGRQAASTAATTSKAFTKIERDAKRAGRSVSQNFAGAIRAALTSTRSEIFSSTTAFAGLAAGAFGAASVKFAGDFEKSLANVDTLLGDASVSVEQYSSQLLELSKVSSKQLLDITKGLYQAISAGIPATEGAGGAMDVLTQAVRAAEAGLSTTEESVNAFVTVMNAYSGTGLTAAKVSDQLFETVKKGRTTFPELAHSLGRVATTAATFGVKTQELLAATSTLTKAGLSTDQAMTALQATILGFARAGTADARKAFEDLGIDASAAGLQANGLEGQLRKLTEATGGNADALKVLFPNIRALRGVAILAGKGFRTFERDLGFVENSIGSTDEALGKFEGTFSKTFDLFISQAQATLVQVGNTILPDVTAAFASLGQSIVQSGPEIAKTFRKVFDVVVAVGKAIGESSGAIKLFLLALVAGKVVAFAGAIKGLVLAFIGVGTAAGGAAISVRALITAMRAIPVVGLILVGVSAALAEIFDNSNDAEEGLQNVSTALQDATRDADAARKALEELSGQLGKPVTAVSAAARVRLAEAAIEKQRAEDELKAIKGRSDALDVAEAKRKRNAAKRREEQAKEQAALTAQAQAAGARVDTSGIVPRIVVPPSAAGPVPRGATRREQVIAEQRRQRAGLAEQGRQETRARAGEWFAELGPTPSASPEERRLLFEENKKLVGSEEAVAEARLKSAKAAEEEARVAAGGTRLTLAERKRLVEQAEKEQRELDKAAAADRARRRAGAAASKTARREAERRAEMERRLLSEASEIELQIRQNALDAEVAAFDDATDRQIAALEERRAKEDEVAAFALARTKERARFIDEENALISAQARLELAEAKETFEKTSERFADSLEVRKAAAEKFAREIVQIEAHAAQQIADNKRKQAAKEAADKRAAEKAAGAEFFRKARAEQAEFERGRTRQETAFEGGLRTAATATTAEGIEKLAGVPGVVGLAASVVTIVKEFPAILDDLSTFLETGIVDFVEQFDDAVFRFLDALGEGLPEQMEKLFAEVLPAVIERGVAEGPRIVGKIIAAIPRVIASIIASLPGLFVAIVRGTIGWIRDLFGAGAGAFVTELGRGFGRFFEQFFDKLVEAFSQIGSLLSDAFDEIIDRIRQAIGLGEDSFATDLLKGPFTSTAALGRIITGQGSVEDAFEVATPGGALKRFFSLFHDGGIVRPGGRNLIGAARMALQGAQGFADGGRVGLLSAGAQSRLLSALNKDDVPSILQAGEGVLKKAAMNALGEDRFTALNRQDSSALAPPQVNVAINSRGGRDLMGLVIRDVAVDVSNPTGGVRRSIDRTRRTPLMTSFVPRRG